MTALEPAELASVNARLTRALYENAPVETIQAALARCARYPKSEVVKRWADILRGLLRERKA